MSNDNYWTLGSMSEDVCNPVLSDLGRIPDAILLPSDGNSNLLFHIWAEKLDIPTTALQADWIRLGKRASILRDSRILKEATHLILFLGPRSDKLQQIAVRELKKKKIVYAVDPSTHELSQMTLADEDV